MSRTETVKLEELVAAHLEGEAPNVPEALRAEFEQAVAAHAALRGMIDETAVCPPVHAADRRPPELPAEYQIEREIGRGGMGVVYLVHQRSLNRQVALKVLRPGEQTFGPLVKRFLGEARHLARLRHPNIVSIHEIGDAEGDPYFTMDYIDGEPLSHTIARGPMPPTQALAILKQVAAAVKHAHRQGIIHRDLKPSNVLVDHEGKVFVTDFGLARDVSQAANLTQSGELLGTPQYMAPEQARGQTSLIGEATDIHALGLLLFEMLTGRPAFASRSPADVIVKLLNEDPPPLRSLDRRIPRDLETICQKMLQKSPADRYASVSALLEDIRRFEAGESLVARRTGLVTRAVRWGRRHWRIAATAIVASALAVAVAAPLFDRSFDELIAWGDEELASGHADVAAHVYTRALKKASEEQSQQVVDRIVQTCRSMDDATAAVDLALQVVHLVPEASFGRHDYLIAQALVARERAKSPSKTIDVWHGKPAPQLHLVKSRLELALAGGLPEKQKLEAEEVLTAVNLVLSAGQPQVRYTPEYLYKLPTGTEDELQRSLNDEAHAVWNRAKAGIALGKLYEGEGRRDEAVASYRRAYELARSVYPMYAGIKAGVGANSRVDIPDAQECTLVRELAETLHRLSAKSFSLPKGRIEFDVIGVKLPPTVNIALSLELCDPSIDDPDQGLPHDLPRRLPLRHDAPVSAMVLDGKYRLRPPQRQSSWSVPEGEEFGRLIEMDVDSWPSEVEIRGNVVKLPPVVLRLAHPVELQEPARGAAVNLSELELRWAAVPGAARYQAVMFYSKETPTPYASYFLTVTTQSPRLRLADLSELDKSQVRENLISGRTGGWRVDAYDADGKCVGKTINERPFLVAGELEGP